MPIENQWFDLTADNNINPISVITVTGVDEPERCSYLDPKLAGVRAYRVKLLNLGGVRNLDEAKFAFSELSRVEISLSNKSDGIGNHNATSTTILCGDT